MRCNLAVIKHMWHSPLVQHQGDIYFPHNIIAINRLDPSHPEWLAHEHIVFVGYDDEWKRIERLPPQGICIESSGALALDALQEKKFSWLIIRETYSADEVIFKAGEYLSRLALWEEDLLEIFVNNADVAAILNHGYQLLHNPLYLLDTSMKMIGYSEAGCTQEFNRWLEEFSKPEGKKKVFENERKYDILNLLANARKSVQISLPVDVFPFISSTIYEGDEKMAVLGCVGCDEAILPESAAMMDFIHDHLSDWIIHFIHDRTIADSHLQGIVQYILLGKGVSDSVLQECARQMKVNEKRFRILRIHLPQDIYTCLKDLIWTAFKEIFAKNWGMAIKDSLIFFITEEDYAEFLCEKKESTLEFARKYDIRILVSLPMDSLQYAEGQYRWMEHTLSLDADSGQLCAAEDAFETAFLQQCLLQNHPEQFCHPQILKLQEHDLHNGSNWISTLDTYLAEERSLISAARKLHIHRNTLIYRMQQISDLTALDFDDVRIRRICMLSCALLKHRHS